MILSFPSSELNDFANHKINYISETKKKTKPCIQLFHREKEEISWFGQISVICVWAKTFLIEYLCEILYN